MNRINYYFYQFFSSFMPIYPVYALLFEQKGFTIFQISMLFTIWTLPAIVLEIPSGILADRWSRKYSLVLSNGLEAMCFLLWLFSDSFFLYAAGFICWGISSAFHSGAKEALLYDSMKASHREDQFDQIYGCGKFISCIGELIACILGGYLSQRFGMSLALLLSILFQCVSAVIALSFTEVNLYQAAKERSGLDLKEMLSEELHFFLRKRTVMSVILLTLFVVGTAEVLDEYDQLIVTDFGLTVATVGIWMAVRKLFSGLGSLAASFLGRLTDQLLHNKKRLYTIGCLASLAAILLAVSVSLRTLWALPLYGLYFFLMAVCSVLAEEYLQKKIEEEGRSTVHSVISLFLNLFGMVFFSILGVVFSWRNLTFGLWMVALFILIVVLISFLIQHHSEKKTKMDLHM